MHRFSAIGEQCEKTPFIEAGFWSPKRGDSRGNFSKKNWGVRAKSIDYHVLKFQPSSPNSLGCSSLISSYTFWFFWHFWGQGVLEKLDLYSIRKCAIAHNTTENSRHMVWRFFGVCELVFGRKMTYGTPNQSWDPISGDCVHRLSLSVPG